MRTSWKKALPPNETVMRFACGHKAPFGETIWHALDERGRPALLSVCGHPGDGDALCYALLLQIGDEPAAAKP